MTLREQIQRDLAAISIDLDNPSIIWHGVEYACVPGPVGTLIEGVEDGGFSPDLDFVCTVSKDLFSNDVYPAPQQTITYNNLVYRVLNIREDATGAFLKLACVSANRGI
jgi:hypothetical protein